MDLLRSDHDVTDGLIRRLHASELSDIKADSGLPLVESSALTSAAQTSCRTSFLFLSSDCENQLINKPESDRSACGD